MNISAKFSELNQIANHLSHHLLFLVKCSSQLKNPDSNTCNGVNFLFSVDESCGRS